MTNIHTTPENNLFPTPQAYAQAAVIAELAAQEMLARLEWMKLIPQVIVDVGCGSGVAMGGLQERYPNATVLALDVAYPMLQYARMQAPQQHFICADTFSLPLADHSVDLLFANLLLPWCTNTEKIFQEWRRVLRPEGLLMFTSLGPDTLAAWHSQLANAMLPNLIDMHEIGDALTKLRFVDPVLDVETVTLRYQEEKKFLQELINSHMLVAGNYTLAATTTELNATYEIVYGHAFGPVATIDQVMDEFGVVNIPLAHLRRQLRS